MLFFQVLLFTDPKFDGFRCVKSPLLCAITFSEMLFLFTHLQFHMFKVSFLTHLVHLLFTFCSLGSCSLSPSFKRNQMHFVMNAICCCTMKGDNTSWRYESNGKHFSITDMLQGNDTILS